MTVERVCSFAQAVHLGTEIQTSQAMSVSRQSLCSLLGTTPNSREHLHEQMSYAIYHNLREEQQKRLMAYMEALKKIESLEDM